MSVKDTNLQYFLFFPRTFRIYIYIYLEKLGRLQELSIVMFVFITGFIHFLYFGQDGLSMDKLVPLGSDL